MARDHESRRQEQLKPRRKLRSPLTNRGQDREASAAKPAAAPASARKNKPAASNTNKPAASGTKPAGPTTNAKPPTGRKAATPAAKPAPKQAKNLATGGKAAASRASTPRKTESCQADPFESLVGANTAVGLRDRFHQERPACGQYASPRRNRAPQPSGMIAVVSNPQSRTYFLREGDQLL